MDTDRFIPAHPDITLDKRLSDSAWLAYCRLEQIAGKSRTVLHYPTRLDLPEQRIAEVLAELDAAHPGCFRLVGRRLELRRAPERFVRLPWRVLDMNVETWQKRLIAAILDQVYETTVNRKVGQVGINKLVSRCRLPARSRQDRWVLVRGTIDLMAREGLIADIRERPGTQLRCRLVCMTGGATCGADAGEEVRTGGATCGAEPAAGASRTTGSAPAAPQVDQGPHHKLAGFAPHPSGQNPKKEPKERTQAENPTDGGEAGKAPAGEEPSHTREGEPNTDEGDDAPKKPTTWERIEAASPCPSTDSPAELAELWRDRRPAIVALYRAAGLEPESDLLVNDILHLLNTTFGRRLPLGAALGPRWGRLEKALAGRIASLDDRITERLTYLLAELGDLAAHTDQAVAAAWTRITGGDACPPVAAIRRLTTTNRS